MTSRTCVGWVGVLSLLAACTGDNPVPDGPAAAPDRFPYPGPFWLDDQGHVALGDDLPRAATAVPSERVAWRTGFSAAQTAVIPLEVDVDPATLSGQDGAGLDGTVQLWDLTAGAQVPCFAELDAYGSADGENAPLVVRPIVPLAYGHEIAVAVTSAVKDSGGDALSFPWWSDAVAGTPGEGVEAYADALAGTVDALDGLGVSDVVLAFSFPVSDPRGPLRTMLAETAVPTAWDLSEVEVNGEDGVELPDGVWRRIQGSITTEGWLVDDAMFELGSDGVPVVQGTADAVLYVHFPDSVRDATPGTVPVWIFGHGIFGAPERYLADEQDESAVIELAERAGVIVIGSTWRGLTTSDAIVAARVGSDFGAIPELTDKLAQSQASTYALTRAILEGDLLDDPAFLGLPAKGKLHYYGISLGGIEGAVLLANQPDIPHGVFHVGGAAWSTMLERSSNWTTFESLILASGLSRMADRQLLYSISQLFWDPVDPISYTDDLVGRSVIWQASIGDDQVPNITTETLARGAGAPLLTPSIDTPFGLDTVTAPTAGPVLVQYDSELGRPPSTNRPAADTATHETPRLWEACKAQTLHFLDFASPGEVVDFCGGPCDTSHTGD